jgi:hypothetical protein
VYDTVFAANASGDVATAFAIGRTAYLTICHNGSCEATARVGRGQTKPQPAVAVQAGSGRAIVLWRGSKHGVSRLQWRITTNGKLGATHTLSKAGDSPRVAIDASGRTVAVWIADRRARPQGVRSTTRRSGEFGAPVTVTGAAAGALRLVTSDAGDTVAAWLTGPNSADPEAAAGTVQVATAVRGARFGAPQSLGSGSTVSLAGSPDGHVVLASDRHIDGIGVVVSAARRAPGAAFGALTDIAPAQFVSDAFGATAAVADGGRGLVSWASGTNPTVAQPAGVFAATTNGVGAFGAPQLLAANQTARPTGAAVSPTAALVAWTSPLGAVVARS